MSAQLYAFDCYRYPGHRACAVHYGERDASTMNEVGNYDRKLSKFYFELEGSGNAWPTMMDSNTLMPTSCACQPFFVYLEL